MGRAKKKKEASTGHREGEWGCKLTLDHGGSLEKVTQDRTLQKAGQGWQIPSGAVFWKE